MMLLGLPISSFQMIIYPHQLCAEWLTEDLRRQVTHDDAVNGGVMLLGLTILTRKRVFFSLHSAVYNKFSSIMICLSFASVLPRKERIRFIPMQSQYKIFSLECRILNA